MLDLPAEVAAEQPAEEIARWYRRWKRRFLAARSTLKWHLAFDPSSANAEEEGQARKIDDQQKAAAKRLGVPETSGGRPNVAVLDAPGELLPALRTAGEPTLCTSRGVQASMTLQYRQTATGQSSRMLLAGLALLVALSIVLFYSKRNLGRSTPALVFAGGLIWWLCLSPSVVGVLVAGTALWATLAARWTRLPRASATPSLPGLPRAPSSR